METPASISNSARAATLIQRAFRGAQRRIAAEQEDLSAILCAMEEADEARINRRESVMSKVNRTLEDFISTVGSKLRGGGEGAATTRALTPKSLTKPALPTLTSGSVQNLIAGLGEDERVAMVDALAILQAATVLFMNEPSVVDVHVPENGRCIVVGDLHGQLVRERDDDAPTPRVVVTRRGPPRDPSERSEDPRRELLLRVVRSGPPSSVSSVLPFSSVFRSHSPRSVSVSRQDDLLHIFRKLGAPSAENVYVFNGDLVDRGDHGCELVLLVFALKLQDPASVHVNRGNHEEPHINIYSGFEEECISKYDHRVFQMFHHAFVWLPYAAVVNDATLVLHAGLPAEWRDVGVADLRGVARGPDVCSEEKNWGKESWIRDILWSDPHPDPAFRGFEESARGAGVLWGEDVTRAFLEKEGLRAIVRSHQCVPAGVAVTHAGLVYTVFSASNYCGTSGNLGAVLVFGHGDERPTETYQWDPAKDPKMSSPVVSNRRSKEIRRRAAVQQAS